MAVLAMLALSCNSFNSPPQKTPWIKNPTFSNDGQRILFDYCDDTKCALANLDIETRDLSLIIPDNAKMMFRQPGIGPARNEIVGIIQDRERAANQSSQIVLINLKSASYKRLTADDTFKASPNYSYDGKWIAFFQSHRVRNDGRLTDWDVYVLSAVSGTQTRLTEHCFYGFNIPFFMPGTNDVVFSAEAPRCNHPTAGIGWNPKEGEKYKEDYREDDILRIGLSGSVPPLIPWIRNGGHSDAPRVSSKGDVLFVSRTNEIDNIKGSYTYDLFLWREGVVKRLTKLGAYLDNAAISQDSRFATYTIGWRPSSFWLLNLESGSSEDIVLAEQGEDWFEKIRHVTVHTDFTH